AAFFKIAYAVIISRGMRSCPMLKCSSERCVWAPQSRSAGTSTSPRLSNSLRTVVIVVAQTFSRLASSTPTRPRGRVPRRALDVQRLAAAAERRANQVAVHGRDELERDSLRAHGLALAVVGAGCQRPRGPWLRPR